MSAKQTQKDAVYSAVMSVLSESNVQFNEDSNISVLLNKERRSQIVSVLLEGFKNKSISIDKTFSSEVELKTYSSSLLSNWIRKDKRLNGGAKYQTQNPGSRVGSHDPQIKALRALMKTQTDEAKVAEIQSFIDNRLAEISSNRKTSTSIDINNLPQELQHINQ